MGLLLLVVYLFVVVFIIVVVVVFISVWNVTGLSDKEPVIYHGHTLTTKVAFRDVIHTINVSSYILIWNKLNS